MSKIDHIPQWGECSWSVHYWRLYLIRYYTLKAVKRCTQIWAYLWATHKNSYSNWRCPQSWGYLCEYLIVTCKTHFWGLSIFGRTPQRNFASAEYRCSLLSIALGGGHFDHTHTVWLYERFVVHHYYGKLRLANAILLISPSGGSPMFRLFVAVNRTNNHAVILLGF